MNYRDAIAYIISREGYQRGFVASPSNGDAAAALGLRRTAALLHQLGRPDRDVRIAHVAGTKGKGSTGAMIAAIARAGGQSVGMYATPHLHTFRERIMLDGEPVPEERFGELTRDVAAAAQQIALDRPGLGPPTAFEIVTVMALLAFSRVQVDLAVVEVGLGGRLDSTNVVTPDVAVISSVSIDHAAILGDTLAEIAAEKGGIIKPGRPVAVGPQQPDALDALAGIAAERDAPLYVAGRDWTTGDRRLTGPWGDWRDVDIALAGRHQVENAGLALMTCWLLDSGLAGSERTVRPALASVIWPGRFELVERNPDTYVDGAHNVDSMRRLAETLADTAAGRPLAIVLGLARDKDLNGMLAAIAELGAVLFATASHNPRAVRPGEIATAAARHSITTHNVPDTGAALDAARQSVGPYGIVCVTGSLYVVAEAREALGLATTPGYERSLLYR